MQKTIENLAKAFIGESQARNRYTMYSKAAKKEGYVQLSNIFLITADNEREHAKWLMKMINELKAETNQEIDEIMVEAAAPTIYGTTVENLKAAIAGEQYENSEMYPEFADTAEAEGLMDVADRLRAIGHAEVHHEDRYTRILEQIEAGTLLKKEKDLEWNCSKCGYIFYGNEPPEKCPSCDHPTKYFEVRSEEY